LQISISSEEKLLNKRKYYVKFIVILMVFLLIVFNIGSWLFFRKIENYLEKGLEKRLYSIAALASHNIEITPGVSVDDIEFLNNPNSSNYLLIQSKLRTLQTTHELEGVYIIDPSFRIIMEGMGTFQVGEKLTYILQDSVELEQAWSGLTAVSPIHIVEGARFKTAYAPLTNIYADVSALLVLEANAEFFNIIRLFRRGLIIGGLASLGAIVLFSIFLSWTIGLFIKTHESFRRTEKLAALGQMSASVAHEIRNPLGIIKTTADVLKSKYESKDQPDELFDFIGAEVRRLNNLVNDFLSFARETKLNMKAGNIVRTVQKTVVAFKRDIAENEISVSIAVNTERHQLKFDAEKIQQVLLNLLINAAQAAENKAEIIVEVGLRQYRGLSYIQIKVGDNGCGIDGEHQKIFEPFYTTKSSGSGLGLAITKQIVETHGGWIEVESTKDKGTTLTFYLPIT